MAKEAEPRSRNWKRCFDADFQVEKKRVDLKPRQKQWLTRAWTHYFDYLPNARPIYNEREGFAHRPGSETQWHHIQPIGETSRLDSQGSWAYNQPRNFVPLDKINHIGINKNDDDFVAHLDTQEALMNYKGDKSAFYEMGQKRRELTNMGLIYHNPDYDTYFRDLADRVVTKYTADFPDDRWPL